MELKTAPEQRAEVMSALAAVLRPPKAAPDPWWQAGIDEVLEPPEA